MGETARVVDLHAVPPPPSWGVAIGEVAELADRWRDVGFDTPSFTYDGLPGIDGDEWLDFCVLAVSVIACLWPPEGEEVWAAELDGEWLDDAPGVFACFTRARAWDPGSFIAWSEGDARTFFAGRGQLQLLPQRAARLDQVARVLVAEGSARSLLERAGWDGPGMVDLLVDRIPGYRDRADTEHGELRFDKLAHLCVAMMEARSPRPITRLETFPVYPDYMLPRILRHHGILRYAPELAARVDTRQLIPEHSPHELAIRWGTVHAAERLRQALIERGNPVTSPQLDYHLWWSAVLGPEADTMGEHHRTLTMSY